MQVPQQIRERLSADDIPSEAYAVVGASLLARQQVDGLVRRAAAALNGARTAYDRWLTTGLQVGTEARERVAAAPSGAVAAARSLQGAPSQVRASLARLRGTLTEQYDALAAEGERAVVQWHAERVLNERADRLTRSVTPAAARATVSARDAARRAAASPTGQRLGEAGRRARTSAGRAWQDYVNAIDESGAAQWGDAALNTTAGASSRR